MNVFEYSEIFNGTNGFRPSAPTGEPLTTEAPRADRLEIMRARVERGEEIIAPDEIIVEKMKQQQRVFIETTRGLLMVPAIKRPSEGAIK